MAKIDVIVKRISAVVFILTFITGVGTFSLFDGIDKTRALFGTIRVNAKQDSIITELEYQLQLKEYAQEMFWEFASLITDDDDTDSWYFADDNGGVYEVDIRSTAEDVELAFIFDVHIIYPVYFDSARNRKYIMVHDYRNAEKQNYYLYKKE